MAKKIGLDFEKSVERELTKRKVVKMKIGGDEYEVRIKYRMNDEDRENILSLFMEMMAAEVEETVAISLAVLHVASDIEFPEDMEGKMKIFVGLYNAGELENLLNSVPQSIFTDVEYLIQGLSKNMEAIIGQKFIENMETTEQGK